MKKNMGLIDKKELRDLRVALCDQVRRYIKNGYRKVETTWSDKDDSVTKRRVRNVEFTKKDIDDLRKILEKLERSLKKT